MLEVQERPDPPVGPGEVRIAVKAAGINFADTMARIGLYPDAPKIPCVVGYEVAGEIESVGDGVDSHRVGDRVVAGTRFNGQAELVTVRADQAFPLPKKRSFEEGAAFPVNYATAYAGLVIMGGLKPGERLLIHAAAGGVGISATQIAKGIAAPPGTRVIDATGMHVMPGIIDAHSHAGLSEINEATNAITPEVRTGDVVDPGKINRIHIARFL